LERSKCTLLDTVLGDSIKYQLEVVSIARNRKMEIFAVYSFRDKAEIPLDRTI
jgi:hypothetical protein